MGHATDRALLNPGVGSPANLTLLSGWLSALVEEQNDERINTQRKKMDTISGCEALSSSKTEILGRACWAIPCETLAHPLSATSCTLRSYELVRQH